MDKYKEGNCTICEKHFDLLHWHHTVPQALGGKNSLQIPLCAQCHNLLHANGEAIVASRRTGNGIKRRFWKTSTEETNAAPYLEILVNAILKGRNVQGKMYTMHFQATPALHRALQLFKMDSGVSSLDAAALLLISDQLRTKGYLEHEQGHSKPDQQAQQNSPNGSLAKMWGL